MWLGTLQAGNFCSIGAPCTYLYHATFRLCDNSIKYRFVSHLEVGPIPQSSWLGRWSQCLVGIRQWLCWTRSVGLRVCLGPLTPIDGTYLVANKTKKRYPWARDPLSSCPQLGVVPVPS